MSTRIDVPTLRAKIVHDALIAHPEIRYREEIKSLFPGWTEEILGQAEDVLVARGREGGITEAADGVLCIHRWRP